MIQEVYKNIGNSGCYLLCLYDVANEFNDNKGDWIMSPNFSEVQHFIDCGWLEPDMFVRHPEEILHFLTHVYWSVEIRRCVPADNKKHYVIEHYSYKGKGHFVRANFNPLDYSKTKEKGDIDSLRVCTPLFSKNII